MQRLALVALGGSSRSERLLVVGRRFALPTALLLTLTVLGVDLVDPSAANAPLFLLVVPVALCAAAYGFNGGVAAAAAAFTLVVGWHLLGEHALGAVGYAAHGIGFLLVGGLVGRFADAHDRLERKISRHHDLSLDLIATANFDGFFTRANPSWKRTFGYSEEELCARPFIDFVHPDDREATIAEALKLAEFGEDAIDFQNRYRAKDGSYVWLEWMAHANADSKEIFCVARDITARKQAEESLHHYQETLEQAVRERTSSLQETTRELEQARWETLRCLALDAEYRDDQTYEHTERVGQTAALIAERIGLPEHEVSLIRLAAPLHDIGKLGVSDLILHKPGKLTAEEFRQVQHHAEAGAAILRGSSSDVLQLAKEIALTHHEWWDGSGYPAGLKDEAIPLSGRIVALADVYDALTHTRPYKQAWPFEQALAEIHALSGHQFDPVVVKAFETLDPYQTAGQPHTRRATDRQTDLGAVA